MKKQKVLIFTHESSIYGANLSLLNFCRELPPNYTVKVILPNMGPLCAKLKSHNIPFKVLFFHPWVYYQWRSKNLLFHLLRKTIRTFEGLSKLTQNLVIIIKNRNWIVDFQPTLIISNSSAIAHGFFIAKFFKIRHVWHLREFLDLDYSLKFYFGSLISKKIISHSGLTIAVSQAVSNHFGVKKNNLVAYEGIHKRDEFKNILKPKYSSNHDTFLFVIVGLIKESKGQKHAILAFQKIIKDYPNCKLLIAGDGEVKTISNLIKKIDLTEKIELVGYIHNPYKLYQKADIALVCSENEAMGRVTLEAMACGTAVIGKNSGGTKELIKNGYNGFLYENDEDLALKMKYCLANRTTLQTLGMNGFYYTMKNFSTDEYVDKIKSFIH